MRGGKGKEAGIRGLLTLASKENVPDWNQNRSSPSSCSWKASGLGQSVSKWTAVHGAGEGVPAATPRLAGRVGRGEGYSPPWPQPGSAGGAAHRQWPEGVLEAAAYWVCGYQGHGAVLLGTGTPESLRAPMAVLGVVGQALPVRESFPSRERAAR